MEKIDWRRLLKALRITAIEVFAISAAGLLIVLAVVGLMEIGINILWILAAVVFVLAVVCNYQLNK